VEHTTSNVHEDSSHKIAVNVLHC